MLVRIKESRGNILCTCIFLLLLVYLAISLAEPQMSKDFLKFSLKQGDLKTHNILIGNSGTPAEFSIVSEGLENIIISPNNRFWLKTGEAENINVNLFVPQNQIPGVYTGKLFIKRIEDTSENIVKVIEYLTEINTKETYFDIKVSADKVKNNLLPLLLDIKNTQSKFPAYVNLELYVEDINRELIAVKKERLLVKDSINFVEELKLDKNIPDFERLIVYAKLRYEGEVTIDSVTYNPNEIQPEITFSQSILQNKFSKVSLLLLIVILLIILLVSTLIFKNKLRKNILSMQKGKYVKRTSYKEELEIKNLRNRFLKIKKLSKVVSSKRRYLRAKRKK